MYSKNLLTFAFLSFSAIALADDVAMPSASEATPVVSAPVKLPPRGSTMNTVEAAFGAPSQREAAVGEPPITRWDYPAFVVYFEYDKVIHSVVK